MSGLASLRRISTPKPASPAPVERCEFCGVGIGERHGHVADVAQHRLLCVCRPCYLLFAPQGAGGGRFRGVGEEVRRVTDLALDEAAWDALRIPVDVAFFFDQDGAEQVAGVLPRTRRGHRVAARPGGVGRRGRRPTRCWARSSADVEAAPSCAGTTETFSCHLVPIDHCYELVGLVRRAWTGLGGGPEVWRDIDAWFTDLDRRSAPVHRDGT